MGAMDKQISISGSRAFYIGHVCSHCKSIVSSGIHLRATGISHKTLTSWASKKSAENALKNAMREAIENLVNFNENKVCLGGYHVLGNPTEDDNSASARYNYDGIEIPCPYCGNIELWQYSFLSSEQKNRMQTLARESIPLLIMDPTKVNVWKALMQNEIQERYRNYWLAHPEDFRIKKEELAGLISQGKDLDDELDGLIRLGPETENRIKNLKNKAKGYALFSPERKRIAEEIKRIDKEYSTYAKTLVERADKIKKDKAENTKKLKWFYMKNPGLMQEIKEYKRMSATAIRYF